MPDQPSAPALEHTPGPWVYVPSDGHVIAGDEQEWEVIAHVPNLANGPIVAAAHGLLAVVEELLRWSETGYVPGDTKDRMEFWVAQARGGNQHVC